MTNSFRLLVCVLRVQLQLGLEVSVALFEPLHVLLPEYQFR
jgi:hypothetical protein